MESLCSDLSTEGIPPSIHVVQIVVYVFRFLDDGSHPVHGGCTTNHVRKGEMKRLLTLIIGLTLALSLLGGTVASASSTCQAYNTQTCQNGTSTTVTTTPTDSETPTATATATSSTLPFTGLDIGVLLVGGVALLGAGLVVRRISRRIN